MSQSKVEMYLHRPKGDKSGPVTYYLTVKGGGGTAVLSAEEFCGLFQKFAMDGGNDGWGLNGEMPEVIKNFLEGIAEKFGKCK